MFHVWHSKKYIYILLKIIKLNFSTELSDNLQVFRWRGQNLGRTITGAQELGRPIAGGQGLGRPITGAQELDRPISKELGRAAAGGEGLVRPGTDGGEAEPPHQPLRPQVHHVTHLCTKSS